MVFGNDWLASDTTTASWTFVEDTGGDCSFTTNTTRATSTWSNGLGFGAYSRNEQTPGKYCFRMVVEDDLGASSYADVNAYGRRTEGVSVANLQFQYSDASGSDTDAAGMYLVPLYGYLDPANDRLTINVKLWVDDPGDGNYVYDSANELLLFSGNPDEDGTVDINSVAWSQIGSYYTSPGSWYIYAGWEDTLTGEYWYHTSTSNEFIMNIEDVTVHGWDGVDGDPKWYGSVPGGQTNYFNNLKVLMLDDDGNVPLQSLSGQFCYETQAGAGPYMCGWGATGSSRLVDGWVFATGTTYELQYEGDHYMGYWWDDTSNYQGGPFFGKDYFHVYGTEPNPEDYEDVDLGPQHPVDTTVTTAPGTPQIGLFEGDVRTPTPVQDPNGDWRMRSRMDPGEVGSYAVGRKWTTIGDKDIFTSGVDNQYWSVSTTRGDSYCLAWIDFYPIFQDANNWFKVRLNRCSSSQDDVYLIKRVNGGAEETVWSGNIFNAAGGFYNEWSNIEVHTWNVNMILWWDVYVSVTVNRNGVTQTSPSVILYGGKSFSTQVINGHPVVAHRGGWASGNYQWTYFDNLRYGTTSVNLDGLENQSIRRQTNSTTEGVLSGMKPGDYYLSSTTFNLENSSAIDWLSTTVQGVNQTQIQNTINNGPMMIESLGNNLYKSWHLIQIPDNQTIGDATLNTTYNILKDGEWVEYSAYDNIIVYNTTDPPSWPLSTVYDELQLLYSNINGTNIDDLNYEEKITLMMQLKYILDMSQRGKYSQLIDYIQGYDVLVNIDEQLNPNNPSKVALLTGISEYTFSLYHYVPPIEGDYIHQINNLTNSGYHVYWITDEYLTPTIFSMVVDRIGLNENENTTIYYSYTGHAHTYSINNTVEDTQTIVLVDGTTITDQELSDLFSVWESEKQFFILNTCYAEGIAYELQKNGRMILSSTPVEDKETVTIFEEHTPFYQVLINNWDWSSSVEENYIILCTIMDEDPVLYDFDEYNDFYI